MSVLLFDYRGMAIRVGQDEGLARDVPAATVLVAEADVPPGRILTATIAAHWLPLSRCGSTGVAEVACRFLLAFLWASSRLPVDVLRSP